MSEQKTGDPEFYYSERRQQYVRMPPESVSPGDLRARIEQAVEMTAGLLELRYDFTLEPEKRADLHRLVADALLGAAQEKP
jgi:hypothetical protein